MRGPPPAAPSAGFPVEVAGTVIPAAPQRIVSASASHTEILYALGAGERIVATDQFSNFPPEAEATPKLDAFNLGVESVAAFAPDLVVLSYDPGDLREGLAALGIPTLLFAPPLTLEDAYGQMRALGAAAGLEPEAAALVAGIEGEVARLIAAVPAREAPSPTTTNWTPLSTASPRAPSWAASSGCWGWRTSPTPPTPPAPATRN